MVRILLHAHRAASFAVTSALLCVISALTVSPAAAAEDPPSAVAQYMEMLPTSTGPVPTRQRQSSIATTSLPVVFVPAPARIAIEAQGGPDTDALKRLIESSPRAEPAVYARSSSRTTAIQGTLRDRASPSGVLSAALSAWRGALRDSEATSALVLVSLFTFAALAARFARGHAYRYRRMSGSASGDTPTSIL